jgi:hypothetical protein
LASSVGAGTGLFGIRVCHAQASPTAWLVPPVGCIALMAVLSAL